IAALLFGAWRLERAASGIGERWVAHGWLAGAQLLLACWLVRESHHLAWALEGPSGTWRALTDLRAPLGTVRYLGLSTTAAGLAPTVRAGGRVWGGRAGAGSFARALGPARGRVAMLFLAASVRVGDGGGRALPPLVHRDALLALAAVVLAMLAAERL